MWGAIEGLVADGAALVLTTQYLEEADRLADDIVVLRQGRTVASGTPAELKARVGDRRVHVAVPDADAFQSAASLFERLEPELDVRARRLTVPAPDGPRDLRAVLDALEIAGIAVDEVALSQPTLDDAFFALAGDRGDDSPGGLASQGAIAQGAILPGR
jgi:ABC-2 type transport system ATP-binding protein